MATARARKREAVADLRAIANEHGVAHSGKSLGSTKQIPTNFSKNKSVKNGPTQRLNIVQTVILNFKAYGLCRRPPTQTET